MQETPVPFLGGEDALEKGIGYPLQYSWASLEAQLVKNPPAMQETWVQSLGWEDSPGEGKGYLLQYSGLENSIDCVVHGVAKSQTQLSDFHFQSGYTQNSEKAMAPHSSTLAWKIPWTEEPGRL